MSDQSPTLTLACELISRPSVTPEDAGCQQLLMDRLEPLGFRAEPMRYCDHNGTVDNLWLRKGDTGPLFVFAGHTDVVPSGPEENWPVPTFPAPPAQRLPLWPWRRRYEGQYRLHGDCH